MKPQIPWLRVFVEGVVIVGSILLAFGIQAWWDDQQLGREIRQELLNVQLELDTNVGLAEFQIDIMERSIAASQSLVATMESAVAEATINTADTLVWLASATASFDASLGALDALIASGRLAAIDDAEMRLRLAGLRSVVEDAVETQEWSRELFFNQQYPLQYNSPGYDDASLGQVSAAFFSAERVVGRPLTSYGQLDYPNTQALRSLIRQRASLYNIAVGEMRGLVQETKGLITLIGDYTSGR